MHLLNTYHLYISHRKYIFHRLIISSDQHTLYYMQKTKTIPRYLQLKGKPLTHPIFHALLFLDAISIDSLVGILTWMHRYLCMK